MITAPPGVRVLVWPAPVDFRRGMDSLAALVQVTLRLDPFAGDVFVFRSRRSDRVKLLLYDGTGLILITKRLEAVQVAAGDRGCGPAVGAAVVRPACPGNACRRRRFSAQGPPAERKV